MVIKTVLERHFSLGLVEDLLEDFRISLRVAAPSFLGDLARTHLARISVLVCWPKLVQCIVGCVSRFGGWLCATYLGVFLLCGCVSDVCGCVQHFLGVRNPPSVVDRPVFRNFSCLPRQIVFLLLCLRGLLVELRPPFKDMDHPKSFCETPAQSNKILKFCDH